MRFEVRETASDVALAAAEWLIARVTVAEPPVRVALSGGTTPKAMFALLAEPARAARMPWHKLHLYWGDERCVPPESPDSNFGEAKRLLLDHVPIPPAQIFPWPTGRPPAEAAASYEAQLRAAAGPSPLFEVAFLGLGEDGHIASLLPGQPALTERTRWAAPVPEGRPELRLTLTYPALEQARTIVFLVTGAGKAGIFRRLRQEVSDVPAAHLRAADVLWFVDRAAVG